MANGKYLLALILWARGLCDVGKIWRRDAKGILMVAWERMGKADCGSASGCRSLLGGGVDFGWHDRFLCSFYVGGCAAPYDPAPGGKSPRTPQWVGI